MSRASAGKTPLAGGGDLLVVSSLTCVVPSLDDSEAGLSYGSQLEHTNGLSRWLEPLSMAAVFPEDWDVLRIHKSREPGKSCSAFYDLASKMLYHFCLKEYGISIKM